MIQFNTIIENEKKDILDRQKNSLIINLNFFSLHSNHIRKYSQANNCPNYLSRFKVFESDSRFELSVNEIIIYKWLCQIHPDYIFHTLNSYFFLFYTSMNYRNVETYFRNLLKLAYVDFKRNISKKDWFEKNYKTKDLRVYILPIDTKMKYIIPEYILRYNLYSFQERNILEKEKKNYD